MKFRGKSTNTQAVEGLVFLLNEYDTVNVKERFGQVVEW